MKFRYLCLAILVVVAYYCRSFLPMMFFGDDGVEVEFNVPVNIVPSASGTYESFDCQGPSFSDGSWRNERRGHTFDVEKISDTQYRTKINYRDYSLCSWRIRTLGWSLKYRDPNSIVSGVNGGGGGGKSIRIVNKSALTQSEINSSNYHEEETLLISEQLNAKVLADRYGGDVKELFISNEGNRYKHTLYFNPYRYRETAKIIYNVTVDESKVKGLTAEQVLANQEKERAEVQE